MQNIEQIYEQYCNTVYKYLFCLTHNEDIAEDLTQETFAIAVKEIKKFKGNCKVSVWLCQIAKHLWYKELKKNRKNKNISLDIFFETYAQKILQDYKINANISSKIPYAQKVGKKVHLL